MNPVLTLAEKFSWTIDHILELPYSTVFVILYRDKINADINKKYGDILRKKFEKK